MSNANKMAPPRGLGVESPTQRVNSGYQVPTDFVDLPSAGKFYPEGSPLHGLERVEVKFMTAREEDLLVSPGLLRAGLVFDRVIESLLVDKRINAKDLLIGDKNAILINARKNAYGDEYEFTYVCQKCNTQNKHTENFSELKIKDIYVDETFSFTSNGTVIVTLPTSKSVVELRFLTGEDETAIDQIVKKKEDNNLPPEPLLTRYRYIIVSVNGNSDLDKIVEFIGKIPFSDSRWLRQKYTAVSPDIDFRFTSDCKSCGHTTAGGVPIAADFFWPEL
jgi:hypothetical protein